MPVGDGFRGEEISFVTFRHSYYCLGFASSLFCSFLLGGFSLSSLSSLSAFIYDDVLLMGELLVFVLFPNVFSDDEEKKKSSNSHVT